MTQLHPSINDAVLVEFVAAGSLRASVSSLASHAPHGFGPVCGGTEGDEVVARTASM